MVYNNIVEGIFLERPNRFIAYVEVDGKRQTVHVKNTGRCRELLIPGCRVVLLVSDNPNRKTGYDLICVKKENFGINKCPEWINMDSQAPNKVVGEWLESSPTFFSGIKNIKSEYSYLDSRIDFYFEADCKKVLMEVKGVTLEEDGRAYFPDAPTKRGTKHVNELIKAKKEGYESYLAFVIQMPQINSVIPNRKTDPDFCEAVENALKAGVKIINLGCLVEKNKLVIDRAFLLEAGL